MYDFKEGDTETATKELYGLTKIWMEDNKLTPIQVICVLLNVLEYVKDFWLVKE